MTKDFAASLAPLLQTGVDKNFNAGEEIPQEFTKDHVFYIQRGYLRLYTLDAAGAEITLHLFEPGTLFPLQNFLDTRYYARLASAFTDVHVIQLERARVWSFLEEHPQVHRQLTEKLLHGIDGLLLRIEILSMADAYVKVILALLLLDKHFGVERAGKRELYHHFTQEDIALIAGVTRETLNRSLSELKKQELVKIQHGHVIIENVTQLEAELQKHV